MTGVDMVTEDLFSYYQEKRRSIEQTTKEEKEFFHEILDNLKNIRNTNQFMLMTINRCIDFSKASNGLKLIPKLESIDLSETLSLPLSCMSNIQNRISIELLPYSKDICSYIITDKQWLQENILCLLSNAVKYSSKGKITVKMTLQHRSKVMESSSLKQQQQQQQHQQGETSVTDRINTTFNGGSYPLYVKEVDEHSGNNTPIEQGTPYSSPSKKSHHQHRLSFFIPEFKRYSSKSQHSPTMVSKVRGVKIIPIQPTTSAGTGAGAGGITFSSFSRVLPSFRKQTSVVTYMSKSGSGTDNISFSSNKTTDATTIARSPHHHPHQQHPQHRTNYQQEMSYQRRMNSLISSETQFLLFELSDEGIGMSEESMRTLFSPFQQNQRLAGGTGLGLYSLAKRIEALKGTYGVKKREDGKQGSCFYFSIPYRPDITMRDSLLLQSHDSEASVEQHQQQFRQSFDHDTNNGIGSSSSADVSASAVAAASVSNQPIVRRLSSAMITIPTKQYHILLVEDTPSIAKMTSMMLKKLGHRVTIAENGEIALHLMIEKYAEQEKFTFIPVTKDEDNYLTRKSLEVDKFDLVLMDLQMPVMDGLESTRRLRKFEKQLEEGKRKMHKINNGIVTTATTTITTQDQTEKSCVCHSVIIGVTAASDEETYEEGIKVGIDDFLPKPFTAVNFNETVKKFSTLYDI
jgi:CheY-like chemotaxis protein